MDRLSVFKSHYQRIKDLYLRYERWLMPATLVVGFFLDYFTFTNIQINTTLILLLIYWLVTALTITFIHLYDAGKLPQKLRYFRLFASLLIQFTFGGLLSGAFIFYWFSGSLWVSWPFILAFIVLMVSNDALRHYFVKPLVQISVFFFITLAVSSVALPFLFNSLSPWLFAVAGVASLLLISLFILLLSAFAQPVKIIRFSLLASITAIFLIMNLLYFIKIIPPVPLALREINVYHSVKRTGNSYVLKGEPETFWQKLVPGHTVHIAPGERVYVYTAIYAPTELKTTITHLWQHYDTKEGRWMTKDTLSFNIIGGRKEGFRGYSWKSHLQPGAWRVLAQTQRGQTVGEAKFKIEQSETPVQLMEVAR